MAESELAPSRRGWWEDGDTSLVSVRSDEDRSGDPSAPASGPRSTLSQRRNVSLPSPASYCPPHHRQPHLGASDSKPGQSVTGSVASGKNLTSLSFLLCKMRARPAFVWHKEVVPEKAPGASGACKFQESWLLRSRPPAPSPTLTA